MSMTRIDYRKYRNSEGIAGAAARVAMANIRLRYFDFASVFVLFIATSYAWAFCMALIHVSENPARSASLDAATSYFRDHPVVILLIASLAIAVCAVAVFRIIGLVRRYATATVFRVSANLGEGTPSDEGPLTIENNHKGIDEVFIQFTDKQRYERLTWSRTLKTMLCRDIVNQKILKAMPYVIIRDVPFLKYNYFSFALLYCLFVILSSIYIHEDLSYTLIVFVVPLSVSMQSYVSWLKKRKIEGDLHYAYAYLSKGTEVLFIAYYGLLLPAAMFTAFNVLLSAMAFAFIFTFLAVQPFGLAAFLAKSVSEEQICGLILERAIKTSSGA